MNGKFREYRRDAWEVIDTHRPSNLVHLKHPITATMTWVGLDEIGKEDLSLSQVAAMNEGRMSKKQREEWNEQKRLQAELMRPSEEDMLGHQAY